MDVEKGNDQNFEKMILVSKSKIDDSDSLFLKVKKALHLICFKKNQ